MTALELLGRLRSQDVKIWAEEDHLRVSAPKETLTPTLQTEIKEYKGELLTLLRRAQGGEEPLLCPRPHDGPIPVSFGQQRLWFLDQLEPGNPAYHICMSRRFQGPLDRTALERALGEIVRRHEVLRTRFAGQAGEPVQIVLHPHPVPLPVVDLVGLTEQDRAVAVERAKVDEAQCPFNLATGPLLRTTLLRLGPQDHEFLLTVHHVVADGWSLGLLVRELTLLYEAFRLGQPSPLAELPIQYGDFSLWQREWLTHEVLEHLLAYWRKQLAPPITTLDLPLDRPRPAKHSSRGASHFFALRTDLAAALSALARQEGVTLFMLLLAAFKVLLYRYTGQEDILVGSPVASRNRVELEPLIGFLANTLVLRTNLGGDPTFRELLERVRKVTLGAYAHQDMPFEKLVEKIQPERSANRNPLFQVSFVHKLVPDGDGIRVENAASPFDLTMYVHQGRELLSGTIGYCTDLFEASTIARMAGHFQTLLVNAVADPDQTISTLPLLTPAEERQVLVDWNRTVAPYPYDQTIHTLFERQVEYGPDAVAVACQHDELTFSELNARANQVARRLREHNVGPGTLVGLCVERSVDLMVGMYGILKAGGAYVPLDPSYPADRLACMLADSQAPVVITASADGLRSAAVNARAVVEQLRSGIEGRWAVVDLRADRQALAALSDTNLDNRTQPDDLAYVIYTSGSTGRPKGVMISHRSVLHLAAALRRAMYDRYPGERMRISMNAPLSFDASVKQVVMMVYGHTLDILPQDVRVDTTSLVEYIRCRRIDVVDCVPSQLTQLLAAGFLGGDGWTPRLVLVGGETIDDATWRVLAAAPATEFFNVYGPTECTVDSTAANARLMPERATIGKPLSNVRVYILDRYGQPVPIGVPGELHIGGAGVGRGYFNRPDLTAEKFIPDRFVGLEGAPEGGLTEARLYKTGDLVRYRSDGNIEFLGRTDLQVKLRGFRIELGEIEAVLRQHPMVREAVVVVREDRPGDKHLVAYVVPIRPPVSDSGLLTTDRRLHKELRAHVNAQLPAYMVPSAFAVLERLPHTPNGKLDRRALPAPAAELAPVEAGPARWDELEVRMGRLWEETLPVRPIGHRDNFFDLGGHSLLAVRLFARLEKEFGRKLPLSVLYEAPTVEQLAALIRQKGWSPSWRSLVPIQPQGSKPPFFGLPGIGGNVLNYAGLARVLGSDQPFYGLQARGLDGKEAPFTSIEDMATHHIQELRTVQPHGPYYLIGWCIGGVIAFEMAHQLVAQGEPIGMLALLETWPPGKTIHRSLLPPGMLGVPYVRFVWQRLAMYGRELVKLTPKDKCAYILKRVRLLRWMITTGDPLGDARTEFNQGVVERANRLALKQYALRPYPGRILQFLAGGRRVSPEQDARMVWRNFATEGTEVYTLPTSSSGGMLTEPHVRVLADHLSAFPRRHGG